MESRFSDSTDANVTASKDPSTASSKSSANASTGGPADGVAHAASAFAELKDYASYYLAARIDGFKGTARNIVLYAVLGVIGAVVGLAMLLTASALILLGLSGAISALVGPRFGWLGPLLVGLTVVGGAAGGVFYVIKMLTGSSRKQTIEKYENLKRDQRRAHGHDVHERARGQVGK